MSWFNRKSRLKKPVKVSRYRSGPVSTGVLEEANNSRPSEQLKEVKDSKTSK
jgi:hypothetical protein